MCFVLDQDFTEKDGQIAHLDHNAANGAEDNLAFLCLKHHSQYDSQTSQQKNYTIGEVKSARKKLCDRVTEWKPCQWFLVLDGMYSEAEKARIETLVEHLRPLLGDPHLTIKRIDPGSIRLLVESSTEAWERMLRLMKTGRIEKLLGYRVNAVQPVPENMAARLPADVQAIWENLGIRADPQEISQLAYQIWESRRRPGGSPEDDWYRAEKELRSRAARAYLNGFIDAWIGRRYRDAHFYYESEPYTTEAASYRAGFLAGQRQPDERESE